MIGRNGAVGEIYPSSAGGKALGIIAGPPHLAAIDMAGIDQCAAIHGQASAACTAGAVSRIAAAAPGDDARIGERAASRQVDAHASLCARRTEGP